MTPRVPFVILTGFLGSGKTTLVNRLLRRRAERGARGKLGVIVNELGEIGIDGALLGGREEDRPARQIELPGGCVCCVLGDDLERTLVELVEANPGLEAIVLETTGVAEPLPIAWAAQRAPADERVRLAAVITLADASNFRGARALSPAVDAQVAYADVVLVTKAELAGAAETALVEAEIRTLASRALVWIRGTDEHAAWLEGVLSDPSIIQPSRPGSSAPIIQPSRPGSSAPIMRPVAPPDGQDPGHVHDVGGDGECRHAEQPIDRSVHGIDSVWVPVRDLVDLEELEDQLAALPANYVRIKGIVRAIDGRVGDGSPSWIAVHRVGLRVSSEPVGMLSLEQPCIVALGPAVRAEALAGCVEAASASALLPGSYTHR